MVLSSRDLIRDLLEEAEQPIALVVEIKDLRTNIKLFIKYTFHEYGASYLKS